MRIELVTPAPADGWKGNGVTAERWRRLLSDLGHDVAVTGSWSGEPVDALVALHARKSAASVRRFAEERPDVPLVLALTGTDLYRDLAEVAEARDALDHADALVVLQQLGVEQVPEPHRSRVWVIHQSVEPPVRRRAPREDVFEVAVLANLREVKDPFLTARAARLLPADSRIEVVHGGGPLDPGAAERAQDEMAANRRYRWLGALPRDEALALLDGARLLVLTSRLEGGANVLSEAIALGTPVVSTRIDGSVGLLGPDYPGYVPVGDADALARMLRRASTDAGFLAELTRKVDHRRPLVDPAREREVWARLLDDVAGASSREGCV